MDDLREHLMIVRARARALASEPGNEWFAGAAIVRAPDTSPKKYAAVIPGARTPVYFGARGYGDFVAHRDARRRASYRKRAEGQRLRDGRRAVDAKGSPAWLSYNLLW